MKTTFLFIFLSFSFICLSEETALGKKFVNVKKLNVREFPNEKSKRVGSKIYRQIVYVEEVKGEWVRIGRYQDNSKMRKKSNAASWIMSKYLVDKKPEKAKSKYEANSINEHIIRSTPDEGRYFLLYVEKIDGNFITLHSRIGRSVTGYGKTEINCNTRKYRYLGYTERNIEYFNYAENDHGNWTKTINGSSKYDLVNYVCASRAK